jgi:hypothetical protein
MNREDENFDQLRRLLKLKRYEQPPPRYFNDFSAQVVARLKADQVSSLGGNWLERLWSAFELKPAVPAAFGAVICGLLVLGAVYTERPEVSNEWLKVTSGESVPRVTPALPLSPNYSLVSISTNPVAPSGSLFDQIRPGIAERAAYPAHPLFR